MFYSIKEGFSGILRTKFSSFIAISIISLSLILIGFFLIFLLNAKKVIDSLQDRIEFEIFIDNSLDTEKIELLEKEILVHPGVQQVHFTSKEEAAEIFKEQFNEDIFDILEENPLPASFQVILAKSYRTSEKAHQLILELKDFDGVDDIEFRKDILVILEKYLKIAVVSVLTIAGLLIIGSILLVSNTIKLVILSRIQIIETMKLVGATRGFIRRPFVVEGVIQGFLGSIFAILFFYLLFKIIKIEISGLIIIENQIFLIIFGLGIVLGFFGSLIGIQRFLKF